MAVANQPPDLAFRTHLRTLIQAPSTPLNIQLIDAFDWQITGGSRRGHAELGYSTDAVALHADANIEATTQSILPELLYLLPRLQQDPQPLRPVITKLIRPLSWATALQYAPALILRDGLHADRPAVNWLAMAVLWKAAADPSDVAQLAGMKDVMTAFIRLWLTTPDIGVAAEAGRLLVALLHADRAGPPAHAVGDANPLTIPPSVRSDRAPGQGLMWRRMFDDKDIYTMLFVLTSLDQAGTVHGQRSSSHTTLAQSRLLAILPRLVEMDLGTLLRGHLPSLEARHGLAEGRGLLDYAAAHMVPMKDVLMHMALVDFYAQLLITKASPLLSPLIPILSVGPHESATLAFLRSRGLHERTIGYYLQPEAARLERVDAMMVGGTAAVYLAKYALCYPKHLVAAEWPPDRTPLTRVILGRMSDILARAAQGRYALREVTPNDLQVMSAVPRTVLLRSVFSSSGYSRTSWEASPVSLLPYRYPDPTFLVALAALFHGAQTRSTVATTLPPDLTDWAEATSSDAAASRALYLLYVDRNPPFFKQLTTFAETPALDEVAMAAVAFMRAIVTAAWAPLPASAEPGPSEMRLPTEDQLRPLLRPVSQRYMPATGVEALLCPPALDTALPFLCAVPPTYSHGVGVGGRGDVASTAYRLAVAKFETLTALHRGIQHASIGGPAADRVAAAVARGPWGVPAAAVGGVVGTMDR